jgi:hypothetical protein
LLVNKSAKRREDKRKVVLVIDWGRKTLNK